MLRKLALWGKYIMSHKSEKDRLKAQGLSDLEIKEALEYEEEQQASERMSRIIEEEKILQDIFAKQKKEFLSEEVVEMNKAQFLSTEIGKSIAAFVAEVIMSSEVDLGLRDEDGTRTLSILDLDQTHVEFIFFDERYHQGGFYFDLNNASVVEGEIKIDKRAAFIKNLAHWARSGCCQSLSLLNTRGSMHNDALVYSDYWYQHKSTSRLLDRLKRYMEREKEKRDYEEIMERMTPEIADKVFSSLRNKDEYRHLFSPDTLLPAKGSPQ